ncbi:ModD protein [Azospirillum sp. TSO22-1]|uniref:ModD protein n=1 Tax=Azospirillum sp. TSO22-1 TaxID=716789 RepID=UPI000D613034|nr:ModD protein [Azospirillum sp. TSO22-1]PWC40385.1 pyrophosphorylase [Azospirillum sp. TSO22-1]
MYRIPDAEIDRLLGDDAPYGDLTTHTLGIGAAAGSMVFTARAPLVAGATEEAARIVERAGGRIDRLRPSGSAVVAGEVLLAAHGTAAALLVSWKVAQTLVEYASGIATAARRIVDAARAVNPAVMVACTRKNFPGTKALAVRAVLAGGASLHRLGLSETVLLFPEHRAFLPGGSLALGVGRLKAANPERTIVVEVNTLAEALAAAEAGADVIQLEKFAPAAVAEAVRALSDAPVKVAAAGGVNAGNAAEYAATGAHVLVTSAPYAAPPQDVKVAIGPEGAALG